MIETLLKQYSADLWQTTVKDLESKSRTQESCFARFQLYFILKNSGKIISLKAIGKILGGRDHSTIISGIKVHENLMNGKKYYKSVIYREKFSKLLEYYESIKDLKEPPTDIISDIKSLPSDALVRIKNVIEEALKQKIA